MCFDKVGEVLAVDVSLMKPCVNTVQLTIADSNRGLGKPECL